ncbi:hypothetical protein [Paractinoplanes hotanensis]|uniref:Uncharacterized protein n=1 Tax=Paractinoplanes hotanensis TaxID=2906497 RepID=A0ABT0Y3Q8_9ACTN|nr:hypothetical protein [Actinoplanes hotanensis]MCM4080622.1 hypothetical protein [Actinoplanes hotanensis]
MTGAEDFRALAWAETALDAATRALDDRPTEFVNALQAADQMLQQAGALFVQMIVHNQVRRLGNVKIVEQYNGGKGWQSVSSESIATEHFRQREIIAFDHPFPRGAMMIYGSAERYGSRRQGTTVRGYILRDSESLAAFAAPAHVFDA